MSKSYRRRGGVSPVLLGCAFFLILGIGFAAYTGLAYANLSNREVVLRNGIEQQEENKKNIHAKVWNILQNQAGVSDRYYDRYEKIFATVASGRGGGEMMKFIQEANPNISDKLADQLMRSIEVQFDQFANEQKKALDMQGEWKNVVRTWPASMFLGGRPVPKVTTVTSAGTTKAFETGEENRTLYDRSKEQSPQ